MGSPAGRVLRLDGRDNVGVVTEDAHDGDSVVSEGGVVTASGTAPQGHKIALRDIAEGDLIIKYGVPIGRAKAMIGMGQHVHTHNVEDITEELCRVYNEAFRRRGGAGQ